MKQQLRLIDQAAQKLKNSVLARRLIASALLLMPTMVLAKSAPLPLIVGIKVGYAIPYGHFTADDLRAPDGYQFDIRSTYRGSFPLELDLSYRIARKWEAGLYAQWGPAQINGGCPDGADCSASDVRAGLQVLRHFVTLNGKTHPWAGLEIGLEWANAAVADLSANYRGWDVSLEGGLGYRFAHFLEAGPFLAFDTGVFQHLDVSLAGGTGSEDIRHQSAHFWIVLGLRVDTALLPTK